MLSIRIRLTCRLRPWWNVFRWQLYYEQRLVFGLMRWKVLRRLRLATVCNVLCLGAEYRIRLCYVIGLRMLWLLGVTPKLFTIMSCGRCVTLLES